MAIILFLMDTSGSMNQRTYLGPTYLDYGKIAVDSFLKIRAKDHTNWKDRYMLVTCEEFPLSIKAGWRDVSRDLTPTSHFRGQLNKLVATSMTNLGGAIKSSLDLLNVHRVQNGLDNYGQGRNPYLLDPAVVVVISDGCKLTNTQTVTDALTLPMHPSFPGSDLTKDPFRWDQRIFSIVLRFKGNVDNDFSENALCDTHINAMCEVTGGKSYAVSSQKSLYQALESINQKVMSGVVVQLEISPVEPTLETWHSTRRMLLVKPSTTQLAHWPLPEGFWPARDARPLRSAIPVIHFSCENKKVNVIDNLPFDKYELEPSPLTQYILELRQPNMCWQTFVKNCGRDKGTKAPFGYLKASVKGTCVNLFVMPYNYPTLFTLLEELISLQRMQPTSVWLNEFKAYIAALPQYYCGPLRVALRRLGIPGSILSLVPEPPDNAYLKSLKAQAKVETARYMEQVRVLEQKMDVPRKHVSAWDIGNLLAAQESETAEVAKNPFHVPPRNILSQLVLLRKEIGLSLSLNGAESLQDSRARFNVPTSKMGLYQEAFAKNLRPVDVNQRSGHMFGNPFKLGGSKKQLTNMVDEVDTGNMPQKLPNRRRQLPLKAYAAPTPPLPQPPESTTTTITAITPVNGIITLPAVVVTPPTPPLSTITPPPEVAPPLSDIQTPPPLKSNQGPTIDARKVAPKPLPAAPKTPSPPAAPKTPPLPATPWVFTPTGPDIAAAIGSGDKTEPAPKRTKPNSIVKENMVTVNPAMRESFLKFNDEGFMDKNKIKGTFGGETNGERREVKTDADYKSKRMKTSDVKRDNKRLKEQIYKELRKPGKNYDQLFCLLNQVKGTTEVRRKFADDVISDAQRFKKKLLIEQLRCWQKELANR